MKNGNQIATFLSLVLLSCSSDTQVADTTGGIETTNGYIVLSNDRVPAANATVQFISQDDWYTQVSAELSPVIDSTTTDGTGFFTIPEGVKYGAIQIDHSSGAIIIDTPRDTVSLTPYQTISGTVPAGVTALRIPGTNWQGEISGETFNLRIPAGTYPVLLRDSSGFSLSQTLVVERDSANVTLENNSTSVLLDDFSGGFEHNPLGKLLGSVRWYSFSDSLQKEFSNGVWVDGELSAHGGSSTVTPEIDSGILSLAVQIRPTADTPYAGFGVEIYKEGKKGIDLSQMTALRFSAQGTGTIVVSLETDTLDSLGLSQYQYEFTPNSIFYEYTIPVSDFHLESKDSTSEASVPWSEISRNIQKVEFIYRGTLNGVSVDKELQIDYIYFDGCSPDDL